MDINQEIFSLMNIFQILGYPLIYYFAYSFGVTAGIEKTITQLEERGIIELEEIDADEWDE